MMTWHKTWLSDENYESAGICDVNGDGILDIVSGAFWYEGPDFRKKHYMGAVLADQEYYDDFSDIALDVTGNGLPDIITGGWFGKTLRWRENPGPAGGLWTDHDIETIGNIETTRAWDIDDDGHLEIVPNCPGNSEVAYWKLERDSTGHPLGKFRKVVIYTLEGGQGHGMGAGDIAGNGRMDIALATGWLEAPADAENGEWIWHPDFTDAPWKGSGGWPCASNPILVADINGDGRSEIISGAAHNYGLWWADRDSNGKWQYHPIDLDCSQYHDMQWADIDGDGKCELVTGKRHRAHNGNDPGEWNPVGIYYFKWTGEGFAKHIIDYAPIGQCCGTGIHFALADLRGTGRLDLVAPGKGGLRLYTSQ